MSLALFRSMTVVVTILAGAAVPAHSQRVVPQSSSPATPLTQEVSGVVQDASGQPIPGAELFLAAHMSPRSHIKQMLDRASHDFPTATSDQQGSFTLVSRPNHYNPLIYARAEGYVDVIEFTREHSGIRYRTQHSSQPTTYTIVMHRATTLEGTVYGEDNQPLPGANVVAYPAMVSGYPMDAIETTVTDGGGAFRLTQVPETSVSLNVSAHGYANAYVTGQPGQSVEVRLDRGHTVRGRAVDTQGNPVPGIEIGMHAFTPPERSPGEPYPMPRQWHGSSVTSAEGIFAYMNVPAGKYRFSVPRHHNEPRTHDILLPDSQAGAVVTVTENGQAEPVTVTIFQGYTIEGKVVEKGTGSPVPGARVWLPYYEHPHRSTLADNEGRFEFTRIFRNSTLQITATADGYEFDSVTDGARSSHHGTTRTVHLEYPTTGNVITANLEMVRREVLTGRVIDAETSQPVSGASVATVRQTYYANHPSQSQSEQQTVTDEDGKFSLELLPQARVRIRAKAEGYAPAVSQPLNELDQDKLVLSMQRGHTVSGVVLGLDEKPFEGATISGSFVIDRDPNNHERQFMEHLAHIKSDSEGRFKLEHVPHGVPFRVSASATGYAPSYSQEIQLKHGQDPTSLTLQLLEADVLAGRLVDENGKPVALATMMAYPILDDPTQSRYGAHSTTDEDGRFSFQPITVGTYRIELYHPKRVYFPDVKSGNADLQLNLADAEDHDLLYASSGYSQRTGAVLHGRVVDYKTGEPVKDFKAVMARHQVKPDPEVEGGFIAEGLSVGSPYQTVRITAPGYAPHDSDSIYVFAGQTRIDKTFHLGPGSSIVGRAVQQGSGKPLPGVSVKLGTDHYSAAPASAINLKHIVTDDQGRFILPDVGSGRKVVVLTPDSETGLLPVTKQIDVQHEKLADLGTVEFGTGGTIKGKLVQTPGNEPIPQAEVTGNGLQSVKTDQEGNFEFTGLKGGLYHVRAPDSGAEAWIGIENLETKELTLEVGDAKLTGQVLRAGQPVPCTVFAQKVGPAQSTSRSGQAGKDGKFIIEHLTPGRWNVRFTGTSENQFTAAESVVMPLNGDDVTQTFNLPSGSLQVKVVDDSDNPLQNATVIARLQENADAPLPPMAHHQDTDENGTARIEHLDSGAYAVTALLPDGRRGSATGQQVTDQQTLEVTIPVQPVQGGTLISTITNQETGESLPAAWCYLVNEAGEMIEHTAERDQNGVLTIENIPPGKYQARISTFGFSAIRHDVEIRRGETHRIEDTLFPAGAVRWVVRDADGAPVVGAECTIQLADHASPLSSVSPRTGTTNEEGLFVIRGLQPGTYIATAETADGRKAEARINVSAANATDAISMLK